MIQNHMVLDHNHVVQEQLILDHMVQEQLVLDHE